MKKPRRLRPLSKRKALHVVREEFRAIEPHAPPPRRPLTVSIGERLSRLEDEARERDRTIASLSTTVVRLVKRSRSRGGR